jgi:3-oxoacyl-(acyl-carrier-protein) synthase
MRNKHRVVITGMGALSALGATTRDLWNGLLANRSGVRRVQRLVDSGITGITRSQIVLSTTHLLSRNATAGNADSSGPPVSTRFRWDRVALFIARPVVALRTWLRDLLVQGA